MPDTVEPEVSEIVRDNKYVVLGKTNLLYAGDDPIDAIGAFALASMIGLDRESGNDVKVYMLEPEATAAIGIGKHIIRATQGDIDEAFVTVIGMTAEEFEKLGPRGGRVQ